MYNMSVHPKNVIQPFFRKNSLDIMLYGFFVAKLDEGLSKMKAAHAMQNCFDWSEDEYPAETMIKNFDIIRKLSKGLNFLEPKQEQENVY